MLLTEQTLRVLVYNILLEGFMDDIVKLKARLKTGPAEPDAPGDPVGGEPTKIDPDEEIIDKLPRKWQVWLIDNFVKKNDAGDNLRDALPSVKAYSVKEASLASSYKVNSVNKYTGAKFKDFVDEAVPLNSSMKNADGEIMKDRDGEDIMVLRHWQNPGDITKMKLIDLQHIMGLYDSWASRVPVDRKDKSWTRDLVGTFGPWELYFPTNQQNSINIAGADPETHKPYTAWCTAQTAGSNLFNNYAMKGVMLFYAINAEAALENSKNPKDPKDPKNRISLGFARGELVAKGHYGGITVDANNVGLNNDDPDDPKTDKINNLQLILGAYYTSILERAKEVVAEHGGVHPVGAEIDAAAKDPVKFNSMLRGLSDAEAADLANSIFVHDRKLSPEVEAEAAGHKSVGVRKALLQSEILSKPVLMKLAGDTDSNVRTAIARRHDLPADSLMKLAEDDDSKVRAAVAVRFDLPEDILNHLQDKETNIDVLASLLFYRPDISEDFINRMANLKSLQVRSALAGNSKTSPEILEKLSNIKSAAIDKALLLNANTPGHVLRKIAFKNKKNLSLAVQNKALSADLLREIVKYCDSIEIKRSEKSTIYSYAASNSNAPEDVLRHAADVFSRSVSVLMRIASNPNTPEDLLRKVADSKAQDLYNLIPVELLSNPKTPDDVIRKLARHTDEFVRRRAINKLRERGIAESRHLAHRILREIKRAERSERRDYVVN
jgi:hypothetical protein